MRLKTTHSVDVVIDGKIKTLSLGEHDVPADAAKKLIKTGAARPCKPTNMTTKPAKVSKQQSDET